MHFTTIPLIPLGLIFPVEHGAYGGVLVGRLSKGMSSSEE